MVGGGGGIGGLTLEEETGSLNNYEDEGDNVGSGYWTCSCDWDEHRWGGGCGG